MMKSTCLSLLALSLSLTIASAQTQLSDADGDTRIETERSGADDDLIYFTVDGTDRLLLRGSRIEPLNNGQSIFIGNGAGQDDDASNNRNLFIGQLAGQRTTTGQQNAALGYQALRNAITTDFNTAIGSSALANLTSGNNNSAIGKRALTALVTGANNGAIGPDAGLSLAQGERNMLIGTEAGRGFTSGSDNVVIGYAAGRNATTGSGNVFIGSQAGRDETGSDKLYIANSATATPLVQGDFAAESLVFNGDVGIGTSALAAGYALSVEGKIIAEEVKIQLAADWPDYVFAPDYELMPLSEVARHIEANGHLPNVPSAAAVKAAGGAEVGEMQRVLLEKIEELTLYLLKADARIEQLERRLEDATTTPTPSAH